MVVGCTNTKLLLLLLDPCSPPMERKPLESKDCADRLELNVLQKNRYYLYLLHTEHCSHLEFQMAGDPILS